jgi:hypothetical protein
LAPAAAVIAGVIAGYVVAQRPPAPSSVQPVRFTISPPKDFALSPASGRQSLALSPDGARIAYTAMDAGGIFRVFVRNLDSIDSYPLPNSAGAYGLFWATDGRSLSPAVPVPAMVDIIPSFVTFRIR